MNHKIVLPTDMLFSYVVFHYGMAWFTELPAFTPSATSTDDLLNHSVNIMYSLPANSMSTRHSGEKQKKLDHALKDGAYFPHLSSAFLLSRKVVFVICSSSF